MAEPLRTYIYYNAMLALSCTATVINFATVCAILFNRALRKRQNVFKFNLALADCTAAVGIFITSFYDYPGIPFRLGNFSWNIPLFTSGLMISIMTTLAIAVERLTVLRFDARRQIVTAKRSIAICVIAWVIIPSTHICIHKFDRRASFILSNVVFPCVTLTCLAITAFCYTIIYKKIAMISDSALRNEALQRRAKKSKKILVTSALIVASTSACWVIMCSVLLEEAFWKMEETVLFDVLSDVGFALVCVNEILNPVIMWLRLTDFRGQLNACFDRAICRRVFGFQTLAHSDATTTTTNLQSISTINISMQEMPML